MYQLIANELIVSLYRYAFMNTDMNQYLIFWYASTVVRKKTAYQLCCAGLARSPFLLTVVQHFHRTVNVLLSYCPYFCNSYTIEENGYNNKMTI